MPFVHALTRTDVLALSWVTRLVLQKSAFISSVVRFAIKETGDLGRRIDHYSIFRTKKMSLSRNILITLIRNGKL